MCFGKKDNYDPTAEPPRPAGGVNNNPSYQSQPASYSNNNNNEKKSAAAADYAPPSGPPPSHAGPSSSSSTSYAPPPGPPPAKDYAKAQPYVDVTDNDFAPPPGPPPGAGASSSIGRNDDFAPPAGPPPGRANGGGGGGDDFAPPPGPPPGKKEEGGPGSAQQHDWQSAVPDTSLFPPPPALFSGFDRSPANNATEAQAEAGTRWCDEYPLAPPAQRLSAEELGALEYHNLTLVQPPNFKGELRRTSAGCWEGRSLDGAPDACLLAYPPLYAVAHHSPLLDGGRRTRTIYYEVRVLPGHGRGAEVTLAMGFSALPYPAFRLPGWHRGSLAVHGDDGHRYVNDMWGGKSFTAPFRKGETYGVGMRFRAGAEGRGGIDAEVFFTRGGQVVGSWDLHEETDSDQDLPVTGLEGYHDLCAAVGAFERVGFEVVFDEARWLYKGQ
ncbi:uncharacterized protein E0L32_004488 [Thyridium curvatum]|uniref:SPRY domain-containing protein n=1 Tax=Thyridium curvatum TaxID=1093900 RepID=A0A507BFL8_9PEZI|nr:uncharacterized protein E0L32_004488 [Thyridium curvatum]TPX15508.1 hypothetical protein E0L32_004488 [Thyridium curvatum]